MGVVLLAERGELCRVHEDLRGSGLRGGELVLEREETGRGVHADWRFPLDRLRRAGCTQIAPRFDRCGGRFLIRPTTKKS